MNRFVCSCQRVKQRRTKKKNINKKNKKGEKSQTLRIKQTKRISKLFKPSRLFALNQNLINIALKYIKSTHPRLILVGF